MNLLRQHRAARFLALPCATTCRPYRAFITRRYRGDSLGDSRFRGNDEGGGNDERSGNNKQPSFPRKRESKPLSFVHLRASANGGFAAANGKPQRAQSALVNQSPEGAPLRARWIPAFAGMTRGGGNEETGGNDEGGDDAGQNGGKYGNFRQSAVLFILFFGVFCGSFDNVRRQKRGFAKT